MGYIAWHIKLDGQDHLVELEHGYWSGKRRVKVDDQIVFEETRFLDLGSIDVFRIREHLLAVQIRAHFIHFSYDLYVDGKSVSTGEEIALTGFPVHSPVPAAPPTLLEEEMRYWWRFRRLGVVAAVVGGCGLLTPAWYPGAVTFLIGISTIAHAFEPLFYELEKIMETS